MDTNLSVDGNVVTTYMFEESLLDREVIIYSFSLISLIFL